MRRVTVGKWLKRFLRHRVDGLFDEPRPGAPRAIADATIEEVHRLMMEGTSLEATH
jgi:transposase